MVIETSRLRLRPIVESDAIAIYIFSQDPLLERYLPFTYVPTIQDAISDIKEYYLKGDFVKDFYFMVERLCDNATIGIAILTEDEQGRLDVCFYTSSNYRNRGYACEATKGIINHMKPGRILVFTVDVGNKTSLRVMEKLGAIEQDSKKRCERVFHIQVH